MDYLLIFIPYALKYSASGYLVGIYKDQKNSLICKSLYILGVQSNYSKFQPYSVIGSYKNGTSLFPNTPRKSNFIYITHLKEIVVNKVIINSEVYNLSACHIILYDDSTLIKSELFLPLDFNSNDEGDHFKTLTYHLKIINHRPVNISMLKLNIIKFFILFFENALFLTNKCHRILSLTTLGMHYRRTIENLYWLFKTYKHEGKITLKTGNYFTSILADVLCGYIILSFLIECKNSTDLFNLIASHTENVIRSIELTVKWLMGSPWGVKLNYPLNYILGNFYLYNIQLWWTFLGLVRPFLETAFFAFLKLGLLGLSHQIAILADIFSIVSFHVYCIYIYAAKLYHWQMSGLHSLSRIFLGRKQNPEPGKVDSCPYTTEQLFVGTICFTVLLFLLPTTLVYYIVFTVMRLGVNIVGGIMTRARYFIQVLPLYSSLVWLFDPQFTATTMTLTPVNGLSNAGTVTLRADRGVTNWYDLRQRCIPDIIKGPPPVRWKEIGWNILVGQLIYPL